MAEKLRDATSHADESSVMYRTPNVGKRQNKQILEEDGIKCFDLGRQSIGEEFDLRQSLGSKLNNSFAAAAKPEALELEEQLLLFSELERLKKENEEMQQFFGNMDRSA